MLSRSILSSVTGWIFCASVAYVGVSIAQNISSTTGATSDNGNDTHHEIDFETLNLFGVTPEFAEQFRLNLLKAIEAAKEQDADPLRQGEFGGVNGGFYQGGGGAGDEDEEEEDDMTPTTPGPGAFGVLSGIFGIFSGLGTLSPTRIIQSTVNFFPPGQRMMAQMIVDSLIGYTPPENRTIRPRPRPRRTTTTPLPIMTDTMIMASGNEMPAEIASKANETESKIVAKDGENNNGTSSSSVDAMSEVINAPAPETTTDLPDFINVHELLTKTTPPPPPPNEDDETDFEKMFMRRATPKPITNSSASLYKINPKATPEEEETLLKATTVIPPSS